MDQYRDKVESLRQFDDVIKMTPLRKWAIGVIALGEFVDGYDLMVIAGALILLKPQMQLSASQVGLLGASAFLGAAIGLLIFGSLTDRIGRRTVFTFNLVFFVFFSLLSAAISNVTELFIIRIFIGVAIGADIATSMAFLTEISPRLKRGSLSGALPQMAWTFGALCSLLVALLLCNTVGSQAWRWMFGLSAVPALVVLVGRRLLPESPRWLIKQGRDEEAMAALELLGVSRVMQEKREKRENVLRDPNEGGYADLFRKPYTRQAILAFVIVGFTPFMGATASVVGPYVFQYVGAFGLSGSLQAGTITWIGGLIGALVAYLTIDRIGRMRSVVTSCWGSFLVSVALALGVVRYPALFLVLFVLLAALTWFGASSFWVLPSELLPTHLRGRAQGLGNGLARLMVAVATFIIPVGIANLGFSATIILLGSVGLVIGLYALTGFKFEPKARSLEEVSIDRKI